MPIKTTPAIERLERHIERVPFSGCWIYMGALNQAGYGWIGVGGRDAGTDRAHRVTYKHYIGEIPKGLEIDHLCRVRSCCNPAHLEAVTRKENCVRGECGKKTGAKQRAKTHCKRGHEYNMTNTYIHSGKRHCKQCGKNARKGNHDAP